MDEVDLSFASVYWTHAEIFGREFTADEMREKLGGIAVGDALEALGRLSCMVEGRHVTEHGRQVQILTRLEIFDESLVTEVGNLFQPQGTTPARSIFFPQQVVELSRLAIRHCDYRERDGFEDGKRAGDFMHCLFGVSDLLGDELEGRSEAAARKFMLRQLGLMSRQETLYLFGRYYELLVRLWPRVHPDGARFDPDVEFAAHTGLTLEEYFVLGFTVYTRFLDHVDREAETADFALLPEKYFEGTLVRPDQWEKFLALLSKCPTGLKKALEAEDDRYGLGTYRCHTFDRAPLAKLGDFYVPTSFASLERAVTEGAFWLLADAAEAKGLPREEFTSPFGKVFEVFAQESLERIAALEHDPPETFREIEYGPKKARVLSSDLSFLYEREGVFFEVVTGRPSVATSTRGDPVAFGRDLDRLVLKKARQLRRCLNDFFLHQTLRFPGKHGPRISRVWPVLLLIEDF